MPKTPAFKPSIVPRRLGSARRNAPEPGGRVFVVPKDLPDPAPEPLSQQEDLSSAAALLRDKLVDLGALTSANTAEGRKFVDAAVCKQVGYDPVVDAVEAQLMNEGKVRLVRKGLGLVAVPVKVVVPDKSARFEANESLPRRNRADDSMDFREVIKRMRPKAPPVKGGFRGLRARGGVNDGWVHEWKNAAALLGFDLGEGVE